jgi:hypothetical protein
MEYVNIIVVCAFLAAAVVNLIGPQPIRAEFAKWGYPDWLRITVATAEFVGSIVVHTQNAVAWGFDSSGGHAGNPCVVHQIERMDADAISLRITLSSGGHSRTNPGAWPDTARIKRLEATQECCTRLGMNRRFLDHPGI